MSIPKYDELFNAFLDCLSDRKEHKIKEIVQYCTKVFQLSDDEINTFTISGQSVIGNRVGWARTYLKKAGLVENTSRGVFIITDIGYQTIQNKVVVDIDYLSTFESFKSFVCPENKNSTKKNSKKEETTISISELSPQEQIQSSINELNKSLADDLMDEVMNMDCYQFEHFVIRLLVAMGYGSMLDNENSATKKSGDGGIDGILKADKFGFDSIYIQAKQWKKDSSVGSPEIQKFAGSMSLHGAQKGLFITTASFTKEAIQTAQINPACKMVLIDGNALAKLMIDYNVGVSIVDTFYIKKVDTDFFNDFN